MKVNVKMRCKYNEKSGYGIKAGVALTHDSLMTRRHTVLHFVLNKWKQSRIKTLKVWLENRLPPGVKQLNCILSASVTRLHQKAAELCKHAKDILPLNNEESFNDNIP